ncbi:cytochrome c oxidase assembly protein [Demequina sp. NBRC 110051]|uniref:cytochrome c oxidase assembly protein n=1 Tax=Demequina sp. NBRC 110051 TaxID=1570340 RepID=UPI0009FC41B8|nr:cytochrome c oxidase assembly protein [Demequina sp. NBRC 110051]
MSVDVLVTLTGAIRDIFLGLTAGALVMLAGVVPSSHRAADRASQVARVAAAVWALAAVAYIFVSYAYIRNDAVAPERFVEEVWSFVTTIDLGQAYLQMALAAVVVSVLAGLVRRPSTAAWTLVPVVWALGWQAQTGHAAGATDHHLATSAMFLHLAGSALWMGVLGALFLMRRPLGLEAKTVVRRSSRIMIWAAVALIVSGIANAWIRMEGPADLVTTTYGWLLLLKVALMSAAIALAAGHRRVALPRLTDAHVRDRFWRIMTVDVAAIVAVIAVAAVLSGTAPPLPIVALEDPSPAYFLTGYELPPAPSFVNWIGLWRLEILTGAAIVAAGVVYVRWVVRLRRRGDAWAWWRTASFLSGLAIMVWITQGGPAVYGMVTFSGHMVSHMMLAMLAPLPLTFGAPVTLALRALPPRRDGSRGPREWVRVIVESRFMAVISNPIFAAVNFAGSLFIFYYTPLFEFALRNHVGHLWMIAHFTLAGYLFANALVGIDPGPKRPAYPMRVVLLFATMAFHAFFGVALTSSEVLLAPTFLGLMGRTWGPDAITDQQYGGQIAWGIGELPVLALAIGVIIAWRLADEKESRRKDRQAERDDDAELRAYNEMLAEAADNDRRLR